MVPFAMKKCIHALVCHRFPVESRTWLHCTVWVLFTNASWRSGKAFKHDIRPCKSLLDMVAHSNSAVEDWGKHWRNAQQHFLILPFELEGFHEKTQYCENTIQLFILLKEGGKKALLICLLITQLPAECKCFVMTSVNKSRLATIPK